MPKNKKIKQELLDPLPDKNNPGYFRALVSNCIKAYEKLSNDGLALDYCKVADKKLRAMVLNDEEYKSETRNIYAKQRLEEMEEVEYLASIAANEGEDDDEDDDWYEARDGKKPPKKMTGVDKDLISMRFKAAQLKRELRAEMSKSEANTEMDAVNLFFVDTSVEEFMKLETFELNEGSGDEDIDSLLGTKEEIPTGTSGRLHNASLKKTETGNEGFDVLPNGEIVER